MHAEHRSLSLLQKVMELEQALFFNFSDAVLRLPVSVINVLHVDEVGQLWFMVRRPSQHISEFDREFRARLDLYRKGKQFHMQVSGKACLVVDPEEINNAHHLSSEMRTQVSSNMVLIKMRAEKIDYFPHSQKDSGSVVPAEMNLHPSAFFKTLQYIFKDIIPVFQSH